MGNLRMITGGLALVVLALAGGTGYLIWERIQSEIGGSGKATRADVETIRTDVSKQGQQIETLRESDIVKTKKIEVLEDEMIAVKGRVSTAEGKIDIQEKLIQKLEESSEANRRDIDAEKAKLQKLQDDSTADRKRLDQIDKELETARNERKQIRDQLKAQGEKIDEQERRLGELEKKGDKRDKDIADLRAEIEELNKLLGRKQPPEQ